MQLTPLIKSAEKLLRDNAPAILTALGVSGVVTTAYLTHIASVKAEVLLNTTSHVLKKRNEPQMDRKDKIKLVWNYYIPPVLSGVATIGCIIAATKVEYRRTAAAQAALSISERAFSEYKDKVVEQFGKNKEQKVRDEIAQDHVRNNPPSTQQVLVTGPGNVLCCELFTGRYFVSDMESLRKARNDINAKLLHHDWATLDDFYYLIKELRRTSHSGNIGWTSDKLMELEFSTVLTEDGKPCLTFEYNYTKPI